MSRHLDLDLDGLVQPETEVAGLRQSDGDGAAGLGVAGGLQEWGRP